MSDRSVAAALRSAAGLVLIEAPGGCGKTFQAAQYASEIAPAIGMGRVLMLAHTHAACDVFASRIADHRRVDIRTIDSLIAQVASAYHGSLALPPDAADWARQQGDRGYRVLAEKVAKLLSKSPIVVSALTSRYPIIVCDEHQDSSADQHSIVMAMHSAGSPLRVFADPMQCIARKSQAVRAEDAQRWDQLKAEADIFDELDYPHRWENAGAKPLGEWILRARASLKSGGRIDLRSGRPAEVSVIYADNEAPRRGVYIVGLPNRRSIDGVVDGSAELLVLSAQNDTVRALRPFFRRRIPVWEGHTRAALATLVNAVQAQQGNAVAVTTAAIEFVTEVSVGFTRADFSDALLNEVASGCTARRRLKPATLQGLGKIVLDEPNHRGVAKMLDRLAHLIASDAAFSEIRLDHPREFREATRLADFENAAEGIAEITRRRTYSRPMPPRRALSTVHKAKGLERANIVVMPCDVTHFPDNESGRCLLYVAMSRATRSLTLVIPRTDPSPLLIT